MACRIVSWNWGEVRYMWTMMIRICWEYKRRVFENSTKENLSLIYRMLSVTWAYVRRSFVRTSVCRDKRTLAFSHVFLLVAELSWLCIGCFLIRFCRMVDWSHWGGGGGMCKPAGLEVLMGYWIEEFRFVSVVRHRRTCRRRSASSD